MPPVALIDTGAIIAIVNADDRYNLPCIEALRSLHAPLSTTEVVLTELFHLIHARGFRMDKAWAFVRSGALELKTIGDDDLPQLNALMEDYADRPMDFADATLVHLAGREQISTILTVDHDDFETYRLPGRKKFRVLPARARS